MSEKVRLYRHFSAAQLDTKFVSKSLALQAHRKGHRKLTEERKAGLERQLELIDEEREHRLPPFSPTQSGEKEGIA